MNPLTIVMAICDTDRDAAVRLFEWIAELNEGSPHEVYPLLILDTAAYGSVGMLQVEEEAKRAFSKRSFCGELPVAPWPQGPNSAFLMACKLATTPFLWLEPDCVLTRDTALDEIRDEYYAQAKPFMGTIVRTEEQQMLENKALPMRHLTGVAVYPAYAREFYHESMQDQPWDLFAAAQILPFVHDTKLIQHFWGMPGNPPTFVEDKSVDSRIDWAMNVLDLKSIPKKAALFHRCKDSSLIDLLRARL